MENPSRILREDNGSEAIEDDQIDRMDRKESADILKAVKKHFGSGISESYGIADGPLEVSEGIPPTPIHHQNSFQAGDTTGTARRLIKRKLIGISTA